MYFKTFLGMLLLLFIIHVVSCQTDEYFTINQYPSDSVRLKMDGGKSILLSDFVRLTNGPQQVGRVFSPRPLTFKDTNATTTTTGKSFSFSTTFVFAIVPVNPLDPSGHGIAFALSPTDKPTGLPSQYLGLFNSSSVGDPANHVFAVELDTVRSLEFLDIDSNHVGIDVNGLVSIQSASAGYYSDEDGGKFRKLTLASGDLIQIWIEYDGDKKHLDVILHPVHVPRPTRPLLSSHLDLSSIISDSMYVGFSSSTGSIFASQYVLAWSFQMNGEAQPIDISSLRLPPENRAQSRKKSKFLYTSGLPLIGVAAVMLMAVLGIIIAIVVRKKRESTELLEDWELEYGGQHRFPYKDLKVATRGFAEEELLGTGGFGQVYRGILPKSNTQVAVKRVSQGSQQGLKEFIAEILSLGRLRHRNLVQLLGYCRRQGELLLVYELMPNGSLDKLLFGQPTRTLDWSERFGIIKGVASGLLYLHEDWEMVVVHRDIKASNVLLDEDMNGRLGDFGLARFYHHGSIPHTTHVAGTFGYLAPELSRTGKATTSTDVFALGVFMLEVACGRRPIETRACSREVMLVDWVLERWRRGAIMDAADAKLALGSGDHIRDTELERVMRLALLCSHPNAATRPTMRQVVQYLDLDVPMPELLPDDFLAGSLEVENGKEPDGHISLNLNLSSVQASVLSGGR